MTRRADLISRSKDEKPVLFRVYKSILALASPVFADMFSLPSQGPPGETQVVDLLENSDTLDLSLRHIYPMRSPAVSELRQVHLLAEFARKYQVDVLGQDIERYLTDVIGRDPVGVLAVATTYKYRAVREQAIRSSLSFDFSDLKSSCLKYAPAELY
jgi:hypothetical protein